MVSGINPASLAPAHGHMTQDFWTGRHRDPLARPDGTDFPVDPSVHCLTVVCILK
jgi:hypothetical protein